MLKGFVCPDKTIVSIQDCLNFPPASCRLHRRCMTLPTLSIMAQERVWDGTPSTTQLLNGTMLEFLKLTKSYVVDPQSRAFALSGSKHHKAIDEMTKELGLPSEIALTNQNKDIFDYLEPSSDGRYNVVDYKNWGSYKVQKALGIVETGKVPDPSGEVYKRGGKWGAAGSPKMITKFTEPLDVITSEAWDTELQLNRYRVMLEELHVPVDRMMIQFTLRDGGIQVALSRGVTRNIYLAEVNRLEDSYVKEYFTRKAEALLESLKEKQCTVGICSSRENWDGRRCSGYCDVSNYCERGQISG